MNTVVCCAGNQNSGRSQGDRPRLSPLEDALQLHNSGLLYDSERKAETTPYKYVWPGVVVRLYVRKCLVDYDFHRLFTRHKATLESVAVTYPLSSDEDERRFPDVVDQLGCDLIVLTNLTYVKMNAAFRSCFPASFLRNLVHYDNLRTLLLHCSTFDFGDIPLRCPVLERISIQEKDPFKVNSAEQAINLAGLDRLKAVRVWSRRSLILPIDNSTLVALDIREVLSLKHQESLTLQVLRAEDCPIDMVKMLIVQSQSIRQLTIAYTSYTDLKTFSVDAREMNYLSLCNVVLQRILSSATKPITALSLSNVKLLGTISLDNLIFSKSLCLTYNTRSRPACILGRISSASLKSLVVGRERQGDAGLTAFDEEAMLMLTGMMRGLEVFGTFAPIKSLPWMPKLKCLGIYSEEQLLLKPPMPRRLHLGLCSSSKDDRSLFTKIPSHYILGKVIATSARYSTERMFWEAMNERKEILDFKPYSFDWTS